MNKTKMIIRVLYFGLVLTICLSCTKSEKDTHTNVDKEATDKTQIEVEESFDEFFTRFGTDSVFQKSRIDFPISFYTFDIEDNKEEYVIPEDEWLFEDFSKDKDASTRSIDAYEPVVEKKNEGEVSYIKRGIDNGIRVEYQFVRKKGTWTMRKVLDYSN